MPTPREKSFIKNLNLAIRKLVDKEEPLQEPSDGYGEQVTPAPSRSLHVHVERRICFRSTCLGPRKTDLISDTDLLVAARNYRSCNRILKGSSAVLVDATRR